jgi:glucokinase
MQDNTTLSSPYILTADIGGSHITTAVCNTSIQSLIPVSVSRVELQSKGRATDILASWYIALQQAVENAGVPISGLGVAMPGPFDYENGISYIKGLDKYEALYEMNIKQCLADLMQLDISQVKFRNDAEATIAGEVLAGAGKEFQNVMGVTLGTGFGSAYSFDNKTIDMNLGSEVFKNSIADDYLSTRWFLKRYFELSGMSVAGVKNLAILAETSELARTIFKEFAINMGDFLAEHLERANPEVLVLCGNITKASRFFLPHLKKQLGSVNIQLAQLGEHAALIGSSTLFNSIHNCPL